jgi:flagellar export protein FliJ
MAFRFTLDAVLRFRESVEHSEEVALLRIVQEIAHTELELSQIDTEQSRTRELRERDLALQLPAVHLNQIGMRELELKTMADSLRARLRQLEPKRVKQLAILQTARQDREVLSELRKRQKQGYQQAQRRQEQKTLDDLFLARPKERN